MVVVELPELDVDHVEVLVAEEVGVEVDVRLGLDLEQALQDVRLLELSEGHLVVVFAVGDVEHAVDHAERVPLLKLRSVLQEEQPWMHLQDLLEELLEIAHRGVLLPRF